ncbi:MAG: 4'-phosphopantetheinyl transferase [Actinobacteria bacterium QS_5_72_10]|nr:MAG: 4'-phosphopantetheinyl transferase [Actinobacteria bacterium QS_5_72_10]
MIGAGECHVWWARPHHGLDAWRRCLTASERARAPGYAPRARQRFVTGRVVARSVLGASLGLPPRRVPLDATCRRCEVAHGKPRLAVAVPPLQLSIAHAGDRVVVAVSRGVAVGVDVERVANTPADPGLMADVLAASERLAVAWQSEPQRPWAVARLWTRKEAVLKIDGRGVVAEAMSTVVVSPPAQPARLVAGETDPPLPRPVGLCDLDPGGPYVASLAVGGRTAPAVRQRWWASPSDQATAAPTHPTPSR